MSTSTGAVIVRAIDAHDDEQLARLLAFEAANGTPRFADPGQLLEWIPTLHDALFLVAEDEATHALVGFSALAPHPQGPTVMGHRLTAVARSHRRRNARPPGSS